MATGTFARGEGGGGIRGHKQVCVPERTVVLLCSRPQATARAVLKGPDFFFFLVKDRPKGPPTANRQLPPIANRQPRPTANRQPLPTATNHPSPTANCRQLPPTANRQPPTANRKFPLFFPEGQFSDVGGGGVRRRSPGCLPPLSNGKPWPLWLCMARCALLRFKARLRKQRARRVKGESYLIPLPPAPPPLPAARPHC